MTNSISKCEEDGFFPDKTDCWIYHICDNGVHSVHACEDELYFNPQTGLCDWPINVNCTSTNKASTEKSITAVSKQPAFQTTYSTQPQLSSPSSSILLSNTQNGENLCSPEDYGYMPYPSDCRKYIYCQDGIAKVFSCQGGLYWKQSDANCVWPLDANCQAGKKTNLIPAAVNTNSTEVSTNVKFSPIQTIKDIYHHIECKPDMVGFYPDSNDCSVYHFCNAEKDQVILCEPGLYYNSEKQVCDWPVNTKCLPKCPPNSEKYRFIDPKSCCRYYECMNGQIVLQSCQYPLQFDVNTKQCTDYAKVKCGIRKECLSPCQYFTNDDTSLCDIVPNCQGKPAGIYLDQNRENCQFFFTCRDNRVFNHSRCPQNFRFNQYEGRCMPAKLVTCSAMKLLFFDLKHFSVKIIIQFLFLLLYFKNQNIFIC